MPGRIAANGAVMTQFPFNRPANKQSLPIRNRIVADIVLSHKLRIFVKITDFQRN
jgi:predicted Rossmann fold nucleotide-binding protein DprA/Smf involved in DNA uptake